MKPGHVTVPHIEHLVTINISVLDKAKFSHMASS